MCLRQLPCPTKANHQGVAFQPKSWRGQILQEPVEVDFEDLDVMAVTDIADLGNGQPLFANFAYEDEGTRAVSPEIP